MKIFMLGLELENPSDNLEASNHAPEHALDLRVHVGLHLDAVDRLFVALEAFLVLQDVVDATLAEGVRAARHERLDPAIDLGWLDAAVVAMQPKHPFEKSFARRLLQKIITRSVRSYRDQILGSQELQLR